MYNDEMRDSLLSSDINERYKALNSLSNVTEEDIPLILMDLLPRYPLPDDFILDLFDELAQTLGPTVLEQYLKTYWAALDDKVKNNVGITFGYIGVSDDFIRWAIQQPITKVKTRHMIASGYFSSIKKGRSPNVLMELIQHIGKYDDHDTQQRLNTFIDNAKSIYLHDA